MKKAGIDTEGPKSSFLQLSEESTTAATDAKFEAELEEEFGIKEKKSTTAAKVETQVEKDDLNDDDTVIPEKKLEEKKEIKKLSKGLDKKIPIIFAEVSSKSKATAAAAPAKTDSTLYNPPAASFPQQKMDKINILRENSMRSLQKNHVWTPSKSERKNEVFSKTKYQQGNKNADLFVSFLGYIRDTSYKQSPPLFDKIKKKFVK
jgi:hypothetical protein